MYQPSRTHNHILTPASHHACPHGIENKAHCTSRVCTFCVMSALSLTGCTWQELTSVGEKHTGLTFIPYGHISLGCGEVDDDNDPVYCK